jgi:hypothetical protein
MSSWMCSCGATNEEQCHDHATFLCTTCCGCKVVSVELSISDLTHLWGVLEDRRRLAMFSELSVSKSVVEQYTRVLDTIQATLDNNKRKETNE